MKLYIVRHGQTDWNLLHILQGKTDIELNETGIKQAQETAQKLQNIKMDEIYASPLKRTMKTASIINQDRNLPIMTDDRLLERGFGELEGLHGSKIDMPAFWNLDTNKSEHGAENIKSFLSRVALYAKEIEEKHKDTDKNILVVTHSGVAIAMNCYFNGIPKDRNLLKLAINTCEYRVYEGKNIDKLNDDDEQR